MTYGFFQEGSANPYIDPWLMCPACMMPIKGEHHVLTIKVPCKMVLHTACAERMAKALAEVRE